MRNAFTMVEIIFVIVVIGILSSVAIPKMVGNTTMAEVANGKQVLGSVRAALEIEAAKRIMSGDRTPITSVSAGGRPFDFISADKNGRKTPILTYPEPSCTNSGCWEIKGNGLYTFHYGENKSCTFRIEGKKFSGACSVLKSY